MTRAIQNLNHANIKNSGSPAKLFVVACFAMLFTMLSIVIVNPFSLALFAYYLCLWLGFIFVFHKEVSNDFCFAFAVNSALISAFYLIQTYVYPDSYGTTSPLGSQTDDSYFFSLVADSIPQYLEVRDGYDLYSHPFTTFIRHLTVLPIDHPLDIIFFQSGTAALLATFSKRFMFQLSTDRRLSNLVYTFALVCPFLMMNGGVIFVRDTFSAALLIYSLACLNERRVILALVAVAIQIAVRPGTGLILLPLYFVIYFANIKVFVRNNPILTSVGIVLLGLCAWFLVQAVMANAFELLVGTSEGGAVGFLGREIFDGLTAAADGNKALLAIQDMPFVIKFFLNGAYIFLYPFLSPQAAFAGNSFDIRAIVLNLIVPIYSFWLNAWFIAGVMSSVRVTKRQTEIVISIILFFLLIGTYSIQTRHKTIIYPLYYFVVAIGFAKATSFTRQIGYAFSLLLIIMQVVMILR